VSGDQLKGFDYECLKLDGTIFDLTGFTVKLFGRSLENEKNTIGAGAGLAGTVASNIATFASIGTVLTLTVGRRRELYLCNIQLTRTADAKPTWTDQFTLSVRAAT
jgi:hypothetical protein